MSRGDPDCVALVAEIATLLKGPLDSSAANAGIEARARRLDHRASGTTYVRRSGQRIEAGFDRIAGIEIASHTYAKGGRGWCPSSPEVAANACIERRQPRGQFECLVDRVQERRAVAEEPRRHVTTWEGRARCRDGRTGQAVDRSSRKPGIHATARPPCASTSQRPRSAGRDCAPAVAAMPSSMTTVAIRGVKSAPECRPLLVVGSKFGETGGGLRAQRKIRVTGLEERDHARVLRARLGVPAELLVQRRRAGREHAATLPDSPRHTPGARRGLRACLTASAERPAAASALASACRAGAQSRTCAADSKSGDRDVCVTLRLRNLALQQSDVDLVVRQRAIHHRVGQGCCPRPAR